MLHVLYYRQNSLYDYLTVNGDNAVSHVQSQASLTDLALDPKILPIVLIPSNQLHLFQISLPKMGRAQLQKAIPFALEDQLAEPIDHCHFAIYSKGNDHHVAVIRKQIMEAILEDLHIVQLQAQAFIPDCLALPWQDDGWTLLIDERQTLARTSVANGYVIDNPYRDKLLEQQLAQTTEAINCQVFTDDPPDFTLLPMLNTQLHPGTPWPLDPFSLQKPSLNLLQAPYKAKRQKQAGKWNFWWIAAGSAISFIVFSLLFKIITYAVIHHKASVIDEQVLAQYRRVFPAATLPLIEPQTSIQSELAKVNSRHQQNLFLNLLSKLGAGMQQNRNLSLLSLRFQNNSLNVGISANQLSSIEQLSRQLQQQSLVVRQNQVQPGKNKVSAELTISET